MEALGSGHEPMQADELQAFGGDDGAAFAAACGRKRGGIVGQGKGGDLNAGVACAADGSAGTRKGPLFEDLIADGVAEAVRHADSIVMGRTGYGPTAMATTFEVTPPMETVTGTALPADTDGGTCTLI